VSQAPAAYHLREALEFARRRLEPEDTRAALAAPISPAEREAARELIRWFLCRYKTPLERLAYVRKAYARWAASAKAARDPATVRQ
jgi:hypothetical protein